MDLKLARKRLEQEATELSDLDGEIAAENDRDAGGEPTMQRQHPADHASEVTAQSTEDAFRINLEQRTQQVRDALHRIDEGTYGVCVRCGRQIPDDRLAARPAAPLCVDCQQITESA